MQKKNPSKRLRYLNLFAIRLPLPGMLSILHRVSGALLVIGLLPALWALSCSIDSGEGYDNTVAVLSHPLVKLIVWGFMWALLHHVCAGVRFLLLDFHIGVELAAARASAVIAFVVSIILTLLFGVWLWA